MRPTIIALLLIISCIVRAQAQQAGGSYTCFRSESDSSRNFYAHYLDDGTAEWLAYSNEAQKITLKLIKSQPGPATKSGGRAVITVYAATANGQSLGWYTFTRADDRLSASYRSAKGDGGFRYFTAQQAVPEKDDHGQLPCR